MLLGTDIPMKLLQVMYVVSVVSGEFKVAAAKPEVHIPQPPSWIFYFRLPVT